MPENDIPNVFVTDDGQLILLEIFEMDEAWQEHLEICNRRCRMTEKKYGTKDPIEMLKKNASRKDIVKYMDAKHDLLIWGYE